MAILAQSQLSAIKTARKHVNGNHKLDFAMDHSFHKIWKFELSGTDNSVHQAHEAKFDILNRTFTSLTKNLDLDGLTDFAQNDENQDAQEEEEAEKNA